MRAEVANTCDKAAILCTKAEAGTICANAVTMCVILVIFNVAWLEST